MRALPIPMRVEAGVQAVAVCLPVGNALLSGVFVEVGIAWPANPA